MTAFGGDGHKGASSDSKSWLLLFCGTWSDGYLAELKEIVSDHDEDGVDTGNDIEPPGIDTEVMSPEESSLPLQWSVEGDNHLLFIYVIM